MEEAPEITVSTVYTFAMAQWIFVQIKGVEKSIGVQADKIEKTGEIGFSGFKLLLKKGETTVGEFNGNSVEGWWIANKD